MALRGSEATKATQLRALADKFFSRFQPAPAGGGQFLFFYLIRACAHTRARTGYQRLDPQDAGAQYRSAERRQP